MSLFAFKNQKTFFIFCILSVFAVKSQNIGINGTGSSAHPSALLDVDAVSTPSLGILIPRIALQAINVATPVNSPATSLLVYNTATASTGTNAVSPGYYYWDGTKWVRFQMNNSGTNTTSWDILGNTGTNPTTNFLGTTDNQDLVFRTNNTEKVRISNLGNVGIGTASGTPNLPNTTLDIIGDVAFRESSITLVNGANNNINIGNNVFVTISGPSASFSITGIANGKNGQIVTLYNSTSQRMVIANLNATSTNTNQILTLQNNNIVTAEENSTIQLQYSASASKWIVINGHNSIASSSMQNGQVELTYSGNFSTNGQTYLTGYTSTNLVGATSGVFTVNPVAGTITILKTGFYNVFTYVYGAYNPSTSSIAAHVYDLGGNLVLPSFKTYGEMLNWPNVNDDVAFSANKVCYITSGTTIRMLIGPAPNGNITYALFSVTTHK